MLARVPILTLLGLCLGFFGTHAARTATVFQDGFESGSLGPAWSVSTTGDGRAAISSDYGPASGQRHLVLDDSVNDALSSVAESTLRLDLSNKRNVLLSFKAKSLGNEPDYPQYSISALGREFDGVSISTDGGAEWYVVESLATVGSEWESFSILLDFEVIYNGRSYGPGFLIRFSEFDNASAPLDGIAIDEVQITAEDDQRAVLELPATVLEGTGPHTGYVLLAFAPTNDVTLDLLASPLGELQLPATVQMPAGQTVASFTFSVVDDALANLVRSVFVSAEAPGITSASAAVTILDDDTPAATLVLPAQLMEGDYTNDFQGSISLNRAPDVPMTLYLLPSRWDEVQLPYAVTIPAGETSTSFLVRAVDDYRIDGTVSVVVTVNSPGMAPATAQTETLDNEMRSLFLSIPATVLEGRATSGILELSGILSTNFEVQLTSANTAVLTVPAVVTVPSGQMQAEFTIRAADNPVRDGSRPVSISASASGFTGTNRTITIRDNEVATYRFSRLTDIVELGRPIPITVSAADAEGNVIDGFNGSVNLSLIHRDGSIEAVTPPSVNLAGVNGWSGNVTLPPVNASPLRLRAEDASGNVGDSIPFDTLRVLDLAAADLAWDPARARFYVSVPADAANTNANKVVVIDPSTAGVFDGVLIGQDPGQLALTSGGENLYVAVDGNGTIARINPATMTVASTFAVGTSVTYGTLYADDISTVVGQPNLLVISQKRLTTYPRHNGVAAYDNGVARPAKTPEFGAGSDQIEPSADPGVFFGYSSENDYGFRRLRLDASGISEIEVKRDLLDGYDTQIRSDGNIVFSSTGVVVDGAQMRRLGRFPTRGPVCPELAANRVYFIEQKYPEYYWDTSFDKIGAYDPVALSKIRSLTLPRDMISPRSFIRWGTNGLAFLTGTNVVLVNSSRLVPSDAPANLVATVNATPIPATVSAPLVYKVSISNQGPNSAASTFVTFALSDLQIIQSALASSGTPVVSSNTATLEVGELPVGALVTMVVTTVPDSAGTVAGTAGVSAAAFDPDLTDNTAVSVVSVGFQTVVDTVSRLRLVANNLIYDPTRNRLWASVPGTAESPLARTIVSIDPNTGLLSVPISIKGEPVPQCMAISANGRYLYVGLSDTNQVFRVDLNSPGITARIPLGLSQFGSENFARDIETLDGDGTSFLATGSSDSAVAVYDGLTRRSVRTGYNSVERIERTATPGVFVGYNPNSSQLSSLTVFAAGVTNSRYAANVISGYGVDIRGAGRLLLSSSGLLVDSTNLTLKANFGVSGKPCLDLPNQRAYFVHGNTLSSFDTATFLPAGTFNLPFYANADWYSGQAETCIRWGLDGFAFLTFNGSVYIWRWSSAIPASADADADGISDAWEATYFGALNVDLAGDKDGDGLCNFLEYLFVTSPTHTSANPVQVSATTVGGQPALRLVFPRRAGLSPRPYAYLLSSDLTDWADALNVSESVLSTQNLGGASVETVEALIPASHPVAGFVRFRWIAR